MRVSEGLGHRLIQGFVEICKELGTVLCRVRGLRVQT